MGTLEVMIDQETAERIVLGTLLPPGGDGDPRPDGDAGAVVVATRHDVILAHGPDAAGYLQGQLSQDVEGLAVGATSWTLLLQPQGKVDAWLRVHRLADDRFLFALDAGFGQQAKARLERFKLRVDVEFWAATVPALAVRGPDARTIASGIPSGIVALDAIWGGIDGVDLIKLDPQDPDVIDAEGLPDPSAILADRLADGLLVEGPASLLDVIRVIQGMPAMGRELDESTIPAAARIVDRSVDFTKGCYVGQELVARIDSRGSNTPTRLVGLRFGGDSAPDVGGELLLDGAPAGKVTSVALSSRSGPIGLAYVKRAVEVPGTLDFQPRSGSSAPVEVVELPSPVGRT